MRHELQTLIAVSSALFLSGCTQEAGEISRDAQAFDGIADTENVTLLGNEPFWNLDIDPDGKGFTARYSTPENIEGSQFAMLRFAGNNGVGFNGELNSETVQVTVTPEECSDGMSDRSYPYTATVAIGERTLYGCGYTSDEPFSGEENP